MQYHKGLIIRVVLALLLGIFYKVYYVVFRPITLHFSYLFLKMIDNSAVLMNEKIITATHSLTFVDACVAASAYLLLTLLILLTKGITPFNRLAMFIYGSLAILAFNILRIEMLFYCLFNSNYNMFLALHLIFWKFLSTIFVFLVWIFLIQIFKVKSVPIYSDMKYLSDIIKKGKKKSRS